jgi:signal transduction histidine kinase
MNGVLGMTDLLLSTSLSAEQTEYGVAVRESAVSLLKIIEEILSFSELETGRLRLRPTVFDLRRIVDDVGGAVRMQAATKGVEMQVVYPDTFASRFVGDETLIRQVLMQLIGNAVKFTEAGTVWVRVTCEDRNGQDARLRISVQDTGIGIASEARGLILQAFAQGDGSLKRRYGGTGIGLPVAKGIVELMGGQMGLESVPNAGSTFWFTLTLQCADTVRATNSGCEALTGAQRC